MIKKEKNKAGIEAFAFIVDINGFNNKVVISEGNSIAQYTRDILTTCVECVEKNNGEVVAFMGDAFLGILNDVSEVFGTCVSIAKRIDQMCEFISSRSDFFYFDPQGPSLKIGIEYGYIDCSTISSKFLGEHGFFIGEPINYVARILNIGEGNRCHIGPRAFELGLKGYSGIEGPKKVKGKKGEPEYTYYQLILDDIWREGTDSIESFQG